MPLSKDFRQLANVGTRHAAALGLAELSDALCIAVSEERGTISVARAGRLRRMASIHELSSALQGFLQEKYPSAERRAISVSLLRENWVAKLVTFALAIGLWYVLVPGSSTIEMTYKIRVVVQNLPPEHRVEEIQPPVVAATFTGPKRAFYFFDPSRLRVDIDLSTADAGRKSVRISAQNVRHPPNITLQQLNPTMVRITARKVPPDLPAEKGPPG